MALVDANYKFKYVDVAIKGVYNNCTLTNLIEDDTNPLNIPKDKALPSRNCPDPHFIIGDKAFPLTKYLMKPFPHRGQHTGEYIYSKRLSHARRIVENAFGIMCSRFRVLSSEINLDPSKVDHIVLACCVLSSFLRSHEGESTSQSDNDLECELT